MMSPEHFERMQQMLARQQAGAPTFVHRATRTETHELTKVFPVLLHAWPDRQHGQRAWAGDSKVPCGNPSWLSPGTIECLACNDYTCHERCGGADITRERQSMAEFLSAQKARRPFPGPQAVQRSVRDCCEVHAVASLPAADLEALRVFFAGCANAVVGGGGVGVAQLHALHTARGLQPPWHDAKPLFGPPLNAAKREDVAAARFGRALWRTVRLELADMVLEDLSFGIMWLSAVLQGDTAPPTAEPLPPLLKDYCRLLKELEASLEADETLVRTRCELARLMAPPPEAPGSFGRVNWECVDNGTPWPTPRAGWFTLFARLPAAERGSNEVIALRALRALEPLREEMRLARTALVPQVVNPNRMFPMLSQNSDVKHKGLDAGGRMLFELLVSERWVHAPCLTAPERCGNLLELTWRSAARPNLESHMRKALQAEFDPSSSSGAQQLHELSGWACCSVPHTRSRVSVKDHPELELEAVSGEGPDRVTPEQLARLHNREALPSLSTIWQLWRGGEVVAKSLMTYRNMDIKVFGPSIEHFGVRNALRRTGLGTVLHQAIVTELLRPKVGWMPSQGRIGLQAVYATGYHRFFEKLGYLWTEETEEGKSSTQQANASVMASLLSGGGGSAGMDFDALARVASQPSVTGRRNEDGMLPLFRTLACAACGTSGAASLKLCARCKCTYFCGEACQRASWSAHKLDCRKLGRAFKATAS